MNQRTLAVAGIGAAVSLVWLLPGLQFDFNYEWITARALLEGIDPHLTVAELADRLGLKSQMQQAHPRLPGALILQAPFGLLPFDWFYITGRLLTVGAGVWLGWLVSRWTDWPVGRALAVVPMALLVWPLSDVLATSKYAALVVAGLVGVSVFARSDTLWSGLPLGVAVVFKLWPWLVVPALWLSGRRRAAYGAVLTFAVLNLVGLGFPHVTVEGTLAAFLSIPGMEGPTNLSPVQWLPIWVGPVIGLVLLGALRRVDRVRLPFWSVPLALATTPVLWPGYLVALVVPAVALRPLLRRREHSTLDRVQVTHSD